MTKLVLGTAQLGLSYGVTNVLGMPQDQSLKRIFDLAEQLGIHQLDTAVAYGQAQKRIGRFAAGRFDVITKIPQGLESTDVMDCIHQCLKETQSKFFRGVLFHSQDDILAYDFEQKLQQLKALRSLGKIEKIGVSVYDLGMVFPLLSDPDISLLQVPLNILDHRASERIKDLKKARPDIEIHVRSVFLQGALLSNPTALPAHLTRLQENVDWFLTFCDDRGVNPGVAALSYVMQHPIDGLVIGIASAKQLRQVHGWWKQASQTVIAFPEREFHDEFDPRFW